MSRNPYRLVLWVIGLAFTAGGAGLGAWVATSQYEVTGPYYELRWGPVLAFLSQLAGMMASPLAIIGLATICGLLFMQARERVRRRAIQA